MPMDETAGAVAEITAAAKRFLRLFALNDVPAVAACYTEDAQMLVANMQPICGRAAIESVFKFTGGHGHTLEFRTIGLDVQGTIAVETGRYVRRRSDASLLDDGKYLVVWKRVGLEWQIYRDMFSTSLPRAAGTAP